MTIDRDLSQRFKPDTSPQETVVADVKGVMAQVILEELFGRRKVDRLYTLRLSTNLLGKLDKPETLKAIAQKHAISEDDARGAIINGACELSEQLNGAEAGIGQEDPLCEAPRRGAGQTRYWR